ncbi:tyrosine kinase family catalytic domain protein, partial [Rhizoctonia solani 123E]
HETYVWSKCQHPNVMRLIGVVRFRDQLAMVSPWLENGDLKSFIRDNPGVDRCALCTQVTDGVAYLHGRGVVHGDLKAANILISHDQTVKITDFGSARLSEYSLQFHTSTKGCGVSPRWTAPEILEERTKTTIATDVYALGMVRFNLLSF